MKNSSCSSNCLLRPWWWCIEYFIHTMYWSHSQSWLIRSLKFYVDCVSYFHSFFVYFCYQHSTLVSETSRKNERFVLFRPTSIFMHLLECVWKRENSLMGDRKWVKLAETIRKPRVKWTNVSDFYLDDWKIPNILKAKHEHRSRAFTKSRKSRKNLRRVKIFVIS